LAAGPGRCPDWLINPYTDLITSFPLKNKLLAAFRFAAATRGWKSAPQKPKKPQFFAKKSKFGPAAFGPLIRVKAQWVARLRLTLIAANPASKK